MEMKGQERPLEGEAPCSEDTRIYGELPCVTSVDGPSSPVARHASIAERRAQLRIIRGLGTPSRPSVPLHPLFAATDAAEGIRCCEVGDNPRVCSNRCGGGRSLLRSG